SCLYSKSSSRDSQFLNVFLSERSSVRIKQERDPGDARDCFLENLKPLTSQRILECRKPRDVSTRTRQVWHQASVDRIREIRKDNWNCVSLVQQCDDCRRIARKNYIWFQPDKFLCKFLNTFQITLGKTIAEAEIATTRPTEIGEALFKRRNPR